MGQVNGRRQPQGRHDRLVQSFRSDVDAMAGRYWHHVRVQVSPQAFQPCGFLHSKLLTGGVACMHGTIDNRNLIYGTTN